MNVLLATTVGFCQANENEILVPNPIIVPDQDNNYFIGILSRKPCQYGKIFNKEELSSQILVEQDRKNVFGDDEDPDFLEREEDINFLLSTLADLKNGAIISTEYIVEDDDVSWEIFEVVDEK